MVNQIVQKYVDIFEDFIKQYSVLEKEYYICNIEVYKKLCFEGELNRFLESLKLYYYKNKHYYLERTPFTYNNFNTIIRQILNKNEIKFNKKIKYNSSKYQIEYHIFFKNNVL